jgi:phenylacetate-CoA ligase
MYWSASTFLKARAESSLPYRSLETINALQNRRVQKIVAHAYASVPHYRNAMNDLGLLPGDLTTAESLSNLPAISGNELADSPERFHSEKYDETNTLTLHSSGTNGRAKAVRYNKAALFETLAHGHRQRAVIRHFTGAQAGYREMGIRRPSAVAQHLRQFYESNAWVPRPMDVQRSVLSLDLSHDEMVDRINEFQPDVLTGYGSQLGALFRRALEQGHNLHHPKLIWYGADAMPETDRALIEQDYAVPVFSTYQADEALRIGFQCEKRKGFHLSLDDVAVRVLKPDGRPAGPGEQGEILVSNLSNRATVLLNYRLGDMVTMPLEACPCGRTLPTIESIAGRANDMITLSNGETRHSLHFIAPLQEIHGIVQVQLVQEDERHMVVNAVCTAGSHWPSIRKSLEDVVSRLTGDLIAVETRQVTALQRESGGKIRAVISHCGRKDA